jgi:MYXO-CTERM domain-containing protein
LLDDVEVFGSVSAVPESSSFATLAGLAMLGFAASRRRSRSTLA